MPNFVEISLTAAEIWWFSSIAALLFRNLGVFAPHLCWGSLLGNRHSSASFSSKATSCGEVSKMSVCRRRKKWVGEVRGHSRSLAMSPLLDHTWFLVVITSNDGAILYRYRDIACYYIKNRKNFPTPCINYCVDRVDLRHYLTDLYQIVAFCQLLQ